MDHNLTGTFDGLTRTWGKRDDHLMECYLHTVGRVSVAALLEQLRVDAPNVPLDKISVSAATTIGWLDQATDEEKQAHAAYHRDSIKRETQREYAEYLRLKARFETPRSTGGTGE